MKYIPTLEEAHPKEQRPTDSPIGEAMLKAFIKASQQGKVDIPVPECIRNSVLVAKKRHNFNGQ